MSDDDLSRGFDAGNYANAYVSDDYATAWETEEEENDEPLSLEYGQAFTLGFFSSYERSEMGEHVETYDAAYAAVGAKCAALGIAVERDETSEKSE